MKRPVNDRRFATLVLVSLALLAATVVGSLVNAALSIQVIA